MNLNMYRKKVKDRPISKNTTELQRDSLDNHIDHGSVTNTIEDNDNGSGDDGISGDVELDSTDECYILNQLQDNMSSLPKRLASFKTWPIPWMISATSLAMSGFFYTLHSDRVECYSCHGKIEQWEAGDDAGKEHKRHFPLCKLVQNTQSDVDEDDVDSARHTGVNNTQYLKMQNKQTFENAMYRPTQQNQSARIVDTTRLFSNRLPPLTRTLFPQYCEKTSREHTFLRWQCNQQTESLVDAGFFSVGEGDTKCFYCGGGLRSWGTNDDPWVEHAKWFPKCDWLIRKKGEVFVKSIQQEFPNVKMQHQNENQRQVSSNGNHQKALHEDNSNIQSIKKRTTFEEAMQSKLVKQILEMGFDDKTVDEVVHHKLTSSGDVFKSATELFEAVMKKGSNDDDSRLDGTSNKGCESLKVASGTCHPDRAMSSGSDEDYDLSLLPDEVKTTLQDLRDKTICKICMDHDACVVFIPCGHLVTCMDCFKCQYQYA